MMNKGLFRKDIQLFLILILSIGVMTVPGQGKAKKDSEDSRLREEIQAVYKSGGEKELLDFVKKQPDRFSNQFIVAFAEAGVRKRNDQWLKVCRILAEGKKDEKILADTLYYTGKYFRLISESRKAVGFYNKALPIYLRLNDPVGRGNIYVENGRIYLVSGDHSKALEMFEKALPLYEEAGDSAGQGKVYYGKGDLNYKTSRIFDAVIMYDKAVPFFEKAGDSAGIGYVYYRKGSIYSWWNNHSKVLEMYDKAFTLFQEAGDTVGQGTIYVGKGKICEKTGDIAGALEMYNKAVPILLKAGAANALGIAYRSIGYLYYKIGENAKALEMYDKALPLFEKAEQPIGIGNVYQCKGRIYYHTGDNAGALEMYDKALPFYIKAEEPVGRGNVYQLKGNVYYTTGKLSKALEMYEKALPFFKKVVEPIGLGNTYLGKGNVFLKTGDNLKALEMFDKALPFFVRAGEISSQGIIYLNKGGIYLNTGKNSKALEMFDKGLALFEKVGYTIGRGGIYVNKGTIYFNTGQSSKAIEMYDKALSYYEKAGEPTGLGTVYLNKGTLYSTIGDSFKALEMLNKALSYFEKSGDPIGQGNVYVCKGGAFSNTGDDKKALEMYDKALTFFAETTFPFGRGNVYRQKGDIYFAAGKFFKAIDMYEKALFQYDKAGQPAGQGYIYWSIGDIYAHIGYNTKALEVYNKALLLFEKAEYPLGMGSVHLSIGRIYSRKKKNKKAFEMYDKALAFYKNVDVIQYESDVLHSKAKLLAKLGKKEQALNLFEKAIESLERIRIKVGFSEMKRTFMEKVYLQYEDTVFFMLENKYDESAFRCAESMRLRIFLDRMFEGLGKLDKGLAPELKEKRDNLAANISLLSKKMHEASRGNDKKKFQAIKERYQNAENQFEELLVKIRMNNPLYASVRYPQPITVKILQKDVLKKGELMLRYFITPGKTYAFLISKNKFSLFTLDIKEKEINDTVGIYLRAVKEKNDKRIRRYANKLYRKLFKPLESRIKKNKEIFLIPDGQLASIPIESLIIGKEKSGEKSVRPVFLLEKYRIKYIQSATLLSLLRKHYRRDNETKNFIGFGDPVYDYENFKRGKPEQGSVKSSPRKVESREIYRGGFARAGGIMNRLPRSGEEVNAIARLFKNKAEKCILYTREQAAEEQAKASAMKDFDYIHFACHGLLNDQFQSLVLSQLPTGKSTEDGYFTLNEIMNCDYNAKLVVLSACRTGSGKLERVEGVTGLTQAVMYAGTPAVVASLWDVDDTATKELMIRFYKNMLEKNIEKTEALRQAKLAMLKNTRYSSPYYWSAFVMYGE